MSKYDCCIPPLNKPTSSLPSLDIQEKKETRRKLLAEIEQRRRENYKRYYAKLKATSRFTA